LHEYPWELRKKDSKFEFLALFLYTLLAHDWGVIVVAIIQKEGGGEVKIVVKSCMAKQWCTNCLSFSTSFFSLVEWDKLIASTKRRG
jgi:hypothetical protein